ncbi:hypothetical protein LI012_08255 [Caldibacillus thermoamylovorans]|uniref:hypothetical protein n=1 Tax=Caldibacillus thermoamylovorans TaxID=35841 RepID=UPI001D092E0A|nr:hypothetical protein [Caldibacillus thermoamylovorans]MCB5935850.1 hypothetical protein [Bacillus sp. DFI.2.34]MCB7076817.1 hypothetical protein [Caldibacillus thermoamylovorans]
MATSLVLVTVLSRNTCYFDDEPRSRRLFKPKNSLFWRRDPFSSSFFGQNPHFLATRPFLVVNLRLETSLFGDETYSRRHFEPKNLLFWRRTPFSSPF